MVEFLASRVAVPVALIALLLLAIAVLVMFIWSIRRHRDPALRIDCDAPLADLMPSLAGLTQSSIHGGNSVELFENGAFFDAMFDEIRTATRTIHFETFLWKEGRLGQRLVDALVERRRAGVTVRVLVDGDGAFPPLQRHGETDIHVASLKPEGSAPAVKVLHHLVVCVARKRIRIQNPYFLPDDEAIEALGQAVARGVRIFEYGKCLLHQKVMSVDGVWCAVGSSNFDDRSFETNDEITLGIRDPALAAQLEAIFESDCRHCVELQLDSWQERGAWHRAKDNLLYSFNELL